MPNVPVVMLIAAAAVLAGVVVVALGRGGELAFFPADYAPLRLDEIAATDVVLFRPPVGLWGYSTQATDEALNRIADALTERDIEIAALRQQVADLTVESPAARRRSYLGPARPPRGDPPASQAGGPGDVGDAKDAPSSGPPGWEVPPPGAPPGAPGGPQSRGAQLADALDVLQLGSSGDRAAPRQARMAGDAERLGLGGAAAEEDGR